MSDKICCILNLAPHYNAPIYKLLDQELKCDFFIGDRITSPMKLMDYYELKGLQEAFDTSLYFVIFIGRSKLSVWLSKIINNIF